MCVCVCVYVYVCGVLSVIRFPVADKLHLIFAVCVAKEASRLGMCPALLLSLSLSLPYSVYVALEPSEINS